MGDSIMCGPEEGAFGVPPRAWAQWLAERLLPRARYSYALACVHAGTNDVRSVDWDAGAYEAALGAILAGVAARAERVCVATVPLDLGRPRAGAKVADLNAIVRRLAAAYGATVVALDDLRGWRHLFPDAVHPTALGQLEIAERAATALGWSVRPSSIAGASTGPRADLRYALGRQTAHLARDLRRRVAEWASAR